MKGIIAVIGIVAILTAIFVLIALGIITVPGLHGFNNLFSDDNIYPDAEYCGYTDMQILDMIEIAAGKDLNNQIGTSYVRSLDMHACGVNDKNPSSILSYYLEENDDWYQYYNDQSSGAGYTIHIVIWTNSNSPSNSTLARSIVIVDGVTVEEMYDYDTIVITSDGTVLTYIAFLAWVNAS